MEIYRRNFMRHLPVFGCIIAIGVGGQACKPRSAARASSAKETPGAGESERDNRSALGGLKGSSDPGQGTFKIKGDYPDKPEFLTSQPPGYKDPSVFEKIIANRDVEAAKQWLDEMADYIYDD